MIKELPKLALVLAGSLALSGCLNLKSNPFAGTPDLYNKEALAYLTARAPNEYARDFDQGSIAKRDWFADDRLVAVSVSGGGMRAAAFTLGVMAELDDLGHGGSAAAPRGALDRIDLISSNSGGSWAIAAMLVEDGFQNAAPLHATRESYFAKFAALDQDRRACWAQRLVSGFTHGGKTFGDVYGTAGTTRVPTIYFNAALPPSQGPFVFTDGFFKRYQVSAFTAPCTQPLPDNTSQTMSLAQARIGMAAAASSAVPGFTKAWARTAICKTNNYSFCYGKQSKRREYIQLMDGVLYDNLGYKSAFEVTFDRKDERTDAARSAIFIDANNTIYNDTSRHAKRNSSRWVELATSSSLRNQDKTFERLRERLFASAGFDSQVLLNFASASGMSRAEIDANKDLDKLIHFAANNAPCFVGEKLTKRGKLRPEGAVDIEAEIARLEAKGADCLSENFARAGYLHKTTYKFDRYRFEVSYQLGQLAVRRNVSKLRAALGY